jgi:hypothetical protein
LCFFFFFWGGFAHCEEGWHIGKGFVLDPLLGMFVCWPAGRLAGWLSAHWEEITQICV